MAYKVFANGNPLLASELNENLMQQVIAVFVDSTGRDTAITSPVEGQFCYLSGADDLQVYQSGAWVNFAGGAGGFETNFLLMGA